MDTAVTYVGAKGPERLSITVSAGSSGLDLTTVTAVELSILDLGTRATITWSAAIRAGATSSQLIADHTYDTAGQETAVACVQRVWVKLTVPSGVRRAGPVTHYITE